MKQLNTLYAARTFQLWKDARVMQWLESNVRNMVPQLDKAISTPSEAAKERQSGDSTALFLEFRE